MAKHSLPGKKTETKYAYFNKTEFKSFDDYATAIAHTVAVRRSILGDDIWDTTVETFALASENIRENGQENRWFLDRFASQCASEIWSKIYQSNFSHTNDDKNACKAADSMVQSFQSIMEEVEVVNGKAQAQEGPQGS